MYEYATPERTLEQRRIALSKANRHRTARAEWKKAVKRGEAEMSPHQLLLEPPAEFESMKVFDVLTAMPKVGKVKARKYLQVARVSPAKTIEGMSDRQRAEVLSLMPRSAGSRGTVRS